jgi:hypothetical protein
MLAAFQQLVDQFIVNRRFASSCHEILLGSLSWLKTQNSGHPPLKMQKKSPKPSCI